MPGIFRLNQNLQISCSVKDWWAQPRSWYVSHFPRYYSYKKVCKQVRAALNAILNAIPNFCLVKLWRGHELLGSSRRVGAIWPHIGFMLDTDAYHPSDSQYNPQFELFVSGSNCDIKWRWPAFQEYVQLRGKPPGRGWVSILCCWQEGGIRTPMRVRECLNVKFVVLF